LTTAPLFAIVDDDMAMRDALAELLEVFDFDCRTYEGSEDFLADHQPGRFAGLITDLNLLGESGLQLQQRLRVLDPGLPVIIITAQSDPATRARVMASEPMAFMTKPIDDQALRRHLDDALARRAKPGGGPD
jgi:FixJ family two-component response regulator